MSQRDLAEDLFNDPETRVKVKDKAYAHKLYAALCNTDWQPSDIMDILREQTWSASWRCVGGIIADLRNEREDYLNWYCSGLEGYVHPDIAEDLARLGWVCIHKDQYLGETVDEAHWGTRLGIAGALSRGSVE